MKGSEQFKYIATDKATGKRFFAINYDPPERCRECGGYGERPTFTTPKYPSGYKTCARCNGTGWEPF